MKVSLENLAITFGEVLAPVLIPIVNMVKDLMTWLSTLDPVTKNIIVTIGLVLASIGPLLIIIGTLASALSNIIAIAPLVGTAFTIMTGPVGIIIMAIAGLIAIVVLLVKNWDTVKETTSNIFNGIKDFFIK
ncbi:MAG: hypothetical protein A2Y24_06895 [Clostridiales bacterium GWE2_32_10]|nr:MAG: hypothetical protein A2Y24_06895 [Clostridiales bacterium GWE2_32_10]HBY19980.1 hypothetical protein [Clostridiales bacterium]